MLIHKCAQFDSKGRGCNNLAHVDGYPLDFCAMHLHMQKDGIPLKCWRCGDDRKKDEEEHRPTTLEKLQAKGYTEEDLEMSNPYTQYERGDYGLLEGEDKYEETGDEPTLGEIVLTWASEFASKYPIPYPYTHPIREIPEHSRVRK
jgi:hypothetical protein